MTSIGRTWFILADCYSCWQNMTSIGRIWFILAYCHSYWQNMQPIKGVLPFCSALPIQYTPHCWDRNVCSLCLNVRQVGNWCLTMEPIKTCIMQLCSFLHTEQLFCLIHKHWRMHIHFRQLPVQMHFRTDWMVARLVWWLFQIFQKEHKSTEIFNEIFDSQKNTCF